MSTSNKLTYLNTTKSKIKDAINIAGANITNEPFRQYPQKLYDEYIDILKNGTSALFANMPRVSDNGTELTLNDTANLSMSLELSASDSTQETTRGVQLFDKNSITNNRYIDTNGVLTSNSSWTVTSFMLVIPEESYTYQGLTETGTDRVVSAYYNSNQEFVSYFKQGTGENTIIIPENVSYIRFSILSTNNDLNTFQFEKGSQATPYEPYTNGASPNPDYPQDINIVTGENSVKLQNKNLYDATKEETTYRAVTASANNQRLYFDGNASSSGNFNFPQMFVKAGTYRLSVELESGSIETTGTGNASGLLFYLYSTPSGNSDYISLRNDKTRGTRTVTFAQDTYMYIHMYFRTSETITNAVIKYQVTKDTGAGDYDFMPYLSQTFPLSLGTLELAKIGDYADKIFNNVPSNPLYDNTLVEGGWYKYKMIEKVTGSMLANVAWTQSSTYTNETYWCGYAASFSNLVNNAECLNNTFQIGKYDTLSGECMNTGRQFHTRILASRLENNDTTGFKSWLETSGLIIYVPLQTPTPEPITDTTLISQLEALKNATSYDEQTNISQTNANRPFIISASAIKNSME